MGQVGSRNRDKRKTVPHVINKQMNSSQKQRLAAGIKRAIQEAGLAQETFLANLIINNGEVQDVVITELGRFMKSEFQYTVTV